MKYFLQLADRLSRLLVLVVTLLVLPSSTICAPYPSIFQYVDLYKKRTILINMDNQTVRNEHLIFPFYVCSENSSYICIFGGLHFAVPRDVTKEDDGWEERGYRFQNLGKERIKLFGKTIEVYRITGSQGEEILWYLYSRTAGLVAFGEIPKEGSASYFILQGELGFGAPQR